VVEVVVVIGLSRGLSVFAFTEVNEFRISPTVRRLMITLATA
jgi:hypothetical protein